MASSLSEQCVSRETPLCIRFDPVARQETTSGTQKTRLVKMIFFPCVVATGGNRAIRPLSRRIKPLSEIGLERGVGRYGLGFSLCFNSGAVTVSGRVKLMLQMVARPLKTPVAVDFGALVPLRQRDIESRVWP